MFHPLGELLNKSIKKAGLFSSLEATLVCQEFQKIIENLFNQEIVSEIKPLHLKNHTLTVRVSNSVLAQELELKREKILKATNQKFGQEVVERMRFLV